MKFYIPYYYRIVKEKIAIWIAWKLPTYLIVWCSIRLMAHATQGEWGNEEPGNVSIMDALKRWESL